MVGKNKSGAGPGFKPQLSHMENGMRRFILVACLLLRKGAWPFPRGMGCSPLVCEGSNWSGTGGDTSRWGPGCGIWGRMDKPEAAELDRVGE